MRAAVALLQMTQCHARNRVAGDYDDVAAFVKQQFNALLRKVEHGAEVASAIRRASAVAEIKKIELRHGMAQLAQNAQSAVSAVEDAHGGLFRGG